MATLHTAPGALVKQSLRTGLTAGLLLAEALVPSAAEMAARHRVSRIAVRRAPREPQADPSRTTPTQVLFDTAALWRALHSIAAEPANTGAARLPAIASGCACQVVTGRTCCRHATITPPQLAHPERWLPGPICQPAWRGNIDTDLPAQRDPP